MSDSSEALEPLAIIGYSFRFPGAGRSPEAFWKMMIDRRCTAMEFPSLRFGVTGHRSQDVGPRTPPARRGHFLDDDLGAFDASFFGISAKEAETMDPQQRLILEEVYHALENAGLPMQMIAGSDTSVFVSSSSSDYAMMQCKDPLQMPKHLAMGMINSMMASRVSTIFDFHGPCVTVDTALSSGLASVELACQSIWTGDAAMGIAIGSNLILTPESSIALENMGFLSPDGRCYSFDSRANGFGRGEGIGVLVIKPLSEAARQWDMIRAVIRSASSNHDGTTPRFDQPNIDSQSLLIEDTYLKAGLGLDKTQYFEANGQGTMIADAVEAHAVGAAFRNSRSGKDPLYMSSVKSNIGHLEGASGIAALIKAILSFERGIIPPNSSNFQTLNQHIDETRLQIKVLQEPVPWPKNGTRRASVHSFGCSGSSTHLVLDDAYNSLLLAGLDGRHCTIKKPPVACGPGAKDSAAQRLDEILVQHQSEEKKAQKRSAAKLLVWSVRDKDGVPRLSKAWNSYFVEACISNLGKKDYLQNLSFTLTWRRNHLDWRTFAVANSTQNLEDLARSVSTAIRTLDSPRIAFIFTGEGEEWAGMGCELLSRYPAFRFTFAQANLYLRRLRYDWSIIELQKLGEASNISRSEYIHPMCTALQLALVDLLESWGITPAVVVGNGSGEIAAAYCAKALDLPSAMRIACAQGKLIEDLRIVTKSGMLSVDLSEDGIRLYIRRMSAFYAQLKLYLCAVNSKKNVVISGALGQLNSLEQLLVKNKVHCRFLPANVGYHSGQMEDIKANYISSIDELSVHPDYGKSAPPLLVSATKSRWVDTQTLLNPEYWAENLIHPVRFLNAMSKVCSPAESNKMVARGYPPLPEVNHVLEIGPHSSLKQHTADILRDTGKVESISYLSMLTRDVSSIQTTLEVAGHLHCSGYPINLGIVNDDISDEKMPKILSDLPGYPFDHSTSYWRESRISQNCRRNGWDRHPLLGVRDPYDNLTEPRWRNVLRRAEVSWIEDHKINGSVLYPAAAMLAMAIEATKHAASPEDEMTGFSIRDAVFYSALRIPPGSEGVEVDITLQQRTDTKKVNTLWFDFRIRSYEGESPVERCTGSVEAIFNLDKIGLENCQGVESRRDTYTRAAQYCIFGIDRAQFYYRLAEYGYNYGPVFQPISSLKYDGTDDMEIISEVLVLQGHGSDVAQLTIHPTTLDGVLQMMTAIYTDIGTEAKPPALPSRIDRLWLSSTGFNDPGSGCVKVHAASEASPNGEVAYTMVVLDSNQEKTVMTIDGLQATATESAVQHVQDTPAKESLCHHLVWKPDVDLLSSTDLRRGWNDQEVHHEGPAQLDRDLDFLLTIYVLKGLDYMQYIDRACIKQNLGHYVDWIIGQKGRLEAGKSRCTLNECRDAMADDNVIDELHRRVECASKGGLFFSSICRSLIGVLEEEITPRGLLEGRLVTDYCREMVARHASTGRFAGYLDLLAHKNPKLTILQIGAGNSPMAQAIVEILSDLKKTHGCFRYTQWDYTDTSGACLRTAQHQFKAEGERMRFLPLNIEEDPEGQGFESGAYDVVVAGAVFHRAVDCRMALKHTRRLLKEGGKLFLFEPVRPDVIRTNFAFGLVESWWVGSERRRKSGPCVETSKWNTRLLKSGFSGSDVVFPDNQDPKCQDLSIICSTAVGRQQEQSKLLVNLQYLPNDSKQAEIAYAIERRITQSRNFGVSHGLIPQDGLAGPSKGTFQICLFELNRPAILDVSKEAFKYLRKMLTTQRNILWVNGGGGASPDPRYRVAEGLFRSLCQEDSRIKITALSLDRDIQGAEHPTCQVMKIIDLLSQRTSANVDDWYIERDGSLHIARVVDATDLNHRLYVQSLPQQNRIQPFANGTRLQIAIGAPGSPHTIQFVRDATHNYPLGPTEIEVEVKAIGVMSSDHSLTTGRIPGGSPGQGFAGIVTRVGTACQRFYEGDRVVACHPGCYRSHVRLDENMTIVKLPAAVSFCQAAGLFLSYTAAWVALQDIAVLKAGETILIQYGGEAAAQAAIQIALNLGAAIFTTVESATEKQLLIDRYGVLPERIFSGGSPHLVDGIRSLTARRGADVIFNSRSGGESWECIAPYGRYVEIVQSDVTSNSTIPVDVLRNNVCLSSINLGAMSIDKPGVVISTMAEILGLLERQLLRPPGPLHVYRISDLDDALRSSASSQSLATSVVEIGAEDPVSTVLDTEPITILDPDASYVIAGGLGKLGRCIVHWLVDRGAQNLIILSRSGAESPHAKEITDELSARAVRVTLPSCDISDEAALKRVLRQCTKTMPPIKGCVQAAVVLRGSSFEDMSYKQWRGAIAPKVQGSWNLHQLLPKGMDFFVMLSDLGALTGARGHANYAAGNSFQSGLAQHRVAIGEKAVALGLGGVSSGAAMHDNVGVRERETQRMRFYPLEEWDLLAVLDQYCHPHAVPFSSSGCHTTVGILRPVQERGYGRPNWATLPMFNHLTLSTLFDMPEKPNFAKLIGWAFSLGEAEDAVTVELRVKLGEFLSMSPDELDPNRPISQYGMDPLFIIHLRGWIATELRARVERSELEGDATIRSVAVRVVQNSEYAKAEWEYHRYERQLYSPAELDGIGLPFMRWGM